VRVLVQAVMASANAVLVQASAQEYNQLASSTHYSRQGGLDSSDSKALSNVQGYIFLHAAKSQQVLLHVGSKSAANKGRWVAKTASNIGSIVGRCLPAVKKVLVCSALSK
jgi:hypothetical protein